MNPRHNYLIWIGLLFALMGLLIYAMRHNPLAMVIDLPLVGLAVVTLALSFLAVGLWRAHERPLVYRGKVVGGAALLLAVVTAVPLINLRFLSYHQEEVSFRNGDIELAGTLYLPRAPGPHPAVVMIHGSGPESRMEYGFYARLFARNGIAGLAYDKRGVGASTGDLYAADYEDYAQDALAAVRFLQVRPEIDPRGVGLMGVSEGEWVAPLAATKSDDVAFVIVTSASGMSPAEQVEAELEAKLRAAGHSEEGVSQALALNRRVFDYQRTGEGADSLRAALREAQQHSWFQDADGLPDEIYPFEEYAWWRSVMDFDPAPVWQRVDVPVLVIKGGKDTHSPAAQAKRNLETALRDGGNRDHAFLVFPAGDHLLLEWPLGERVPPPVFADGYLDTLVTWIQRRH